MTHRPNFKPAAAFSRAGLEIPEGTRIAPTIRKAAKSKAKPEAKIQRAIIKAAEKVGALVLRTNAGLATNDNGDMIRIGAAGTSDLQLCFRGRWISLEVKAPGRKATAKQADFLAKVRKAGGIAEVVSSVDEALAILMSVGP